jgi:predicted amidohydrolase
MKIAVAKYPIGIPRSFEDFAQKQRMFIAEAAAAGADVAVLPEYLSLELGACFEAAVREDLCASLAALQAYREAWLALFADLARTHRMCLVAGTFLLDPGHGAYRNRADLFGPDGAHVWQDKLQLTGFEKKTGIIMPGDALKVFGTGGIRMGISICYDIRSRRTAAAGA